MKIHKDVEKGNFVIYLIRPELMLKEKSDLWVINSMKIGDMAADRIPDFITRDIGFGFCRSDDKQHGPLSPLLVRHANGGDFAHPVQTRCDIFQFQRRSIFRAIASIIGRKSICTRMTSSSAWLMV